MCVFLQENKIDEPNWKKQTKKTNSTILHR
jgi:hypothetical protein